MEETCGRNVCIYIETCVYMPVHWCIVGLYHRSLFIYMYTSLFTYSRLFLHFSTTTHDYVNMPVYWGIVGLSCVVVGKISKET